MKQKKLTDLLALLVFTVFAVCTLGVLLTGAGAYRRLADRGREQYTARTAAQYLATRVRQGEDISLEDFGGCDSLAIREDINGKTYVTRVYCHDGWLRELFSAESASLSPEDGETVLEVETLSFSMDAGMLTVYCGGQEQLLLLRTGREAIP